MGYFYTDSNGNRRYVPDGEQYQDDDPRSFTDSKGNKGSFEKVEPKKFMNDFGVAKQSQPEDKRWRVDDTSHTEEDYSHDKLYVTDRGSVIAVTPDGDIISVCVNAKSDPRDSARTLLEWAVKNGGKKFDSYEGNYGVYTHLGFEPVSWCKWNGDYAPYDWDANRDYPEDIIFFKYTGKPFGMKIDDWKASVKCSSDYDEAMEKRDREIKNG